MQHLDLQVIERALQWLDNGQPIWLCTVLATFGSSPREPGSMMVARSDGQHVGSLSGGCVEEDFLARLRAGDFHQPLSQIRYGNDEVSGPKVTLPCGGVLDVLIERLTPTEEHRTHLQTLREAMRGQQSLIRSVLLDNGESTFVEGSALGPRVERDEQAVRIRVGPTLRLIIAGISPVSAACAEFAQALGFDVIVCDPRDDEVATFNVPGVNVEAVLPSLYIEQHAHAATAVVALTHDPRIDDLAMMEAVRTEAFYIGVMGSRKTSSNRAERLRRSGGLSDADIERLHMPIGLAIGSKTPAEIALAVMADIIRVHRGRPRHAL